MAAPLQGTAQQARAAKATATPHMRLSQSTRRAGLGVTPSRQTTGNCQPPHHHPHANLLCPTSLMDAAIPLNPQHHLPRTSNCSPAALAWWWSTPGTSSAPPPPTHPPTHIGRTHALSAARHLGSGRPGQARPGGHKPYLASYHVGAVSQSVARSTLRGIAPLP